MERVLFYLPVVTPGWFDNIVAYLIRRLAECAEVHGLVPPPWRSAGIGREQLQGCALAKGVVWHITDGSSEQCEFVHEHPAGGLERYQDLQRELDLA